MRTAKTDQTGRIPRLLDTKVILLVLSCSSSNHCTKEDSCPSQIPVVNSDSFFW